MHGGKTKLHSRRVWKKNDFGSLWIQFILLKTENNKKKIKKLLFTRVAMFTCLNALFVSHEQCKRRWKKKKAGRGKHKTHFPNAHFISRIHPYESSEHLAFRSRHKHQNRQRGTNLQKSIFLCLPNLPCHEANNSITLYGITQWILNKQNTIDHNSYAIGQWRRRWSQLVYLMFYSAQLWFISFLIYGIWA